MFARNDGDKIRAGVQARIIPIAGEGHLTGADIHVLQGDGSGGRNRRASVDDIDLHVEGLVTGCSAALNGYAIRDNTRHLTDRKLHDGERRGRPSTTNTRKIAAGRDDGRRDPAYGTRRQLNLEPTGIVAAQRLHQTAFTGTQRGDNRAAVVIDEIAAAHVDRGELLIRDHARRRILRSGCGRRHWRLRLSHACHHRAETRVVHPVRGNHVVEHLTILCGHGEAQRVQTVGYRRGVEVRQPSTTGVVLAIVAGNHGAF